MEVSCPRCKKSVRVNDVGAGGRIRVACSECGAKFEISVKKKVKTPVSESLPEPEKSEEAADGNFLDKAIERESEQVEDKTAVARPESSGENLTFVQEQPMQKTIDPHKLAVIEEYRNEWKNRLDDIEIQRAEAAQDSVRKHNAELRRHRAKNLLLIVAYLAAFAALAIFLMQK